MIENTKVQVHPANESSTIQAYQCFGWELLSSQEIKNSESHLERRGDTIYNVTTRENYVNLIFKRDTNMPHYAEVVNLERQFHAVPKNRRTKKFSKRHLLWALGLPLIVGVSQAAMGSSDYSPAYIVGGISIGLWVLLFILRILKNKKIKRINGMNNAQRGRIAAEASRYL